MGTEMKNSKEKRRSHIKDIHSVWETMADVEGRKLCTHNWNSQRRKPSNEQSKYLKIQLRNVPEIKEI